MAVLLENAEFDTFKTQMELSDIAFVVMMESDVEIEPLLLWTQEWEHPDLFINPALLHNIAKDGVRL